MIVLILCFYCCCLQAQDGYKQWLSVQQNNLHLRENCTLKKVYCSNTGQEADIKLQQLQRYRNQRLVQDKMYREGSDELLYNLQINYEHPQSAVGLNLLDSSTIGYAFTADLKIRYYVIDEQSSYHIIYTYDQGGKLIRCKDCMDPFGNHEWCAYYTYQYDTSSRLQSVHSYNLMKNEKTTSKILFAVDTLLYRHNLLDSVLTTTPQGLQTQYIAVSYYKNRLKKSEKRVLFYDAKPQKTILKEYHYQNKKLGEVRISYFDKNYKYGYQIKRYDVMSRIIAQSNYNEVGSCTKMYKMEYD